MKYKARCTHCISLLKNLKKYADAELLFNGNECYIEVEKRAGAIHIEKIEKYQARTFQYYNGLANLIEGGT